MMRHPPSAPLSPSPTLSRSEGQDGRNPDATDTPNTPAEITKVTQG